MDHHDVARQIEVEHQMLAQLMEGVRITTGWQVEGNDASRKLSTLHFVVESFQHHLDRLLTVEEHGSYMDLLVVANPRLGQATNALQAEHDLFRTEVRQIAGRLAVLSETDLAELGAVSEGLLGFMRQIKNTTRRRSISIKRHSDRTAAGKGEARAVAPRPLKNQPWVVNCRFHGHGN